MYSVLLTVAHFEDPNRSTFPLMFPPKKQKVLYCNYENRTGRLYVKVDIVTVKRLGGPLLWKRLSL